MATVAEYYDYASLPRDSLTRAAEKAKRNGALYLGAGIGVEQTKDERFRVLGGGGTHDGPLSAVTAAFKLAGGKSQAGTPGGAIKVAEPSVAARLWELDAQEAECKSNIARYERQLARAEQRNTGLGSVPFSGPSSYDDSQWEQRRIDEMKVQLGQIDKERKLLLAGKVAEAAASKPGTNWTQVTPEARKKVDPLVKHWMSKPHPWQACVNELGPEKGMEAAKRICSVVKDMGMRSTKWRKGGKKVSEREIEMFSVRLLEAAHGDSDIVERYLLVQIMEAEGVAEREFGAAQRKRAAKSGAALPDGSFPIHNATDLANARKAVGRAHPSKRAKVRAHIAKRAKALGVQEDEVPPAPENTPEGKRAAEEDRKRKAGTARSAVLGRTTSGTPGDVDAGGYGVSEALLGAPWGS